MNEVSGTKINGAGPQPSSKERCPGDVEHLPRNEDPTTNIEVNRWEQKEDAQRCVRAELTLN